MCSPVRIAPALARESAAGGLEAVTSQPVNQSTMWRCRIRCPPAAPRRADRPAPRPRGQGLQCRRFLQLLIKPALPEADIIIRRVGGKVRVTPACPGRSLARLTSSSNRPPRPRGRQTLVEVTMANDALPARKDSPIVFLAAAVPPNGAAITPSCLQEESAP